MSPEISTSTQLLMWIKLIFLINMWGNRNSDLFVHIFQEDENFLCIKITTMFLRVQDLTINNVRVFFILSLFQEAISTDLLHIFFQLWILTQN